jgi:hypothetical protein
MNHADLQLFRVVSESLKQIEQRLNALESSVEFMQQLFEALNKSCGKMRKSAKRTRTGKVLTVQVDS